MTSFAATTWRALRRLLHPPGAPASPDGPAVVLDGMTAIAVTESRIAQAAALGASFPAAAGARAWSRLASGRPDRTTIETLGPRAAIASALGLATAGERATVFASGPDLLAAQDLLVQTAGRHVPLVVHLACRAPSSHAQALGTGHEAYHAGAESGAIHLFAMNVQEAVDLALIARRTAERTLVPAIVAMDGEQTALAAQDVHLPDATLVRTYLGDPASLIDTPTAAQRLLFGATRRVVPRWFDLDRPMMLGPLQGPEAWGLGAAGRGPHFDDHVTPILDEAVAEFAEQTGRECGALFEHGLAGAEIVLVAQGSAVETAVAAANAMRAGKGTGIGVLGVRCLRPFPGPAIVERLRGVRFVAILERLVAPPGSDGPLQREVLAALGRATLGVKERPRVTSVHYGMGGLPLRVADLLALIRRLDANAVPRMVLGVDFIGGSSDYPKREALAGALRRADPTLETLGVRSGTLAPDIRPPDVRPPGAVTLAIARRAGGADRSIAGEAATLIHELVGGHFRSRPALTWEGSAASCLEVLTHSREPLFDPGDDVPIDVLVAAAPTTVERVAAGGVVLVPETSPLPAGALARARAGDLAIATIPSGAPESLLGGLLALFMDRITPSPLDRDRVRAAREKGLAELPAAERERRLEEFEIGYGSIRMIATSDLPTDASSSLSSSSLSEITAPPALRSLSRTDPTMDCLSRFWDQTGALYRAGDTGQLAADPYSASGTVPLLSSALREIDAGHDPLPAFDPGACGGNGRLWTSCPDGSIGAAAFSARALIDAGIGLASERGHPADALRSVAGNLAKRVNRIVAAGDAPPDAGPLLERAYHEMTQRTPGDDATLAAALAAVIGVIGELEVARTAVFFDEPEKESPGSGELFTLVVNPDACRSAAAILAEGEGLGLRAVARTPENVDAARRRWTLWQLLPDTRGETIARVRKHGEVGPLAALLLSRHCRLSLAAGDGAEAGSGATLAVRSVLAAAEFHLQPRWAAHLDKIDALRRRLSERVREQLADGLPADDLDALADGLRSLGRDDVDVAALSTRVGQAVEAKRVDGAHLGRLVDAARGLADLHWRLAEGQDGLGRARVGVTIAPGAVAGRLAVFPWNPFPGPVAVDASGETASFARGLIEGQLAQSLAAARLVRWAERLLDPSRDNSGDAADLTSLGYPDLTTEERELCPPMLIVGDGRSLGAAGFGHLAWLLRSGLPVKVLVLADAGGEADSGLAVDAFGDHPAGQRLDLALLATLGGRSFVAQTSLADQSHFAASVLDALAYAGPALLHVHAPSPERHGFPVARLHEQTRRAVASRAFPLFRYDPAAGGVFGSRLDLSGNPDAAAPFAPDETGAPYTPVDWAFTEERFADHFPPLSDRDPAPTPVAEYLQLDAATRSGKTPIVEGDDDRRRVAPALIADADERLRLWRTLEEIAGIVTPFTERVWESAAAAVEVDHAAAIEAVRSEYETRLAGLRAEYESQAVARVTAGLMTLAGCGASDVDGHGGAS